jgi:peptidoglycan/xylan/chitin deacetylase (PgdA/CDA1 family)/uncharacterized protein YraI
MDCQVIGAASLGDTIEVTGSITNGFYPVRWFGVDGFAHSLFVTTGSVAPWFVEGDVSCKRVAFSFNIGIGNTPSQTVLNTLVQKDVDATMFPMGWWAEAHPDYLRALNAAGFVIGTHGDQMLFLTDQGDATIRKDVTDSIAAIESVIGRPMDPYFTPYAADTDNRVRTIVSELGLLPVGWKIAAADYGTGVTEQFVYSQIMNNIYPGAVVEFHLDGPSTAQSTARALPRIIDDLRARGYEFVTVPQMTIPCSTSLPPPMPERIGTVVNTAGANLNCRSQPSTSGPIIARLAPGAKVTVRGATANNWVPVFCGNQDGWVSANYLSIADVPSTPTPTPPPGPTPTPSPTPPPGPTPTPTPGSTTFGTVSNTGGANLRCRTQPATSGGIITSLGPGTRVEVRGAAANGWVPIRCANQNGWVSAAYLTVESGTGPTPTPGATGYGTVSNTGGATLRCRTGPGTTSAIITSLGAGTRVEIRGATSNGWAPVVCAGRDGWVSATYLIID